MRVVTVGSGMDGTGKSVIAANLGLAFALRGLRTCVVDLDLGSADLHLLLGQLAPGPGVLAFLRGEARSLAEVAIPNARHPRLSVVPGAGETLRAAGLAGDEVAQIGAGLRKLPMDVVVVDLPGGVAHQSLDLFLAGDTQIVVTTSDPLALAQAGQLLRLARVRRATHAGAPDPVRRPRVYDSIEDLARDMIALRADAPLPGAALRPLVVFNRCANPHARMRDDWLALLRLSAGDDLEPSDVTEVPEDEAVARAARGFCPLLELAPGAPASRVILELAARLAPVSDGLPGRAGQREPAPR